MGLKFLEFAFDMDFFRENYLIALFQLPCFFSSYLSIFNHKKCVVFGALYFKTWVFCDYFNRDFFILPLVCNNRLGGCILVEISRQNWQWVMGIFYFNNIPV